MPAKPCLKAFWVPGGPDLPRMPVMEREHSGTGKVLLWMSGICSNRREGIRFYVYFLPAKNRQRDKLLLGRAKRITILVLSCSKRGQCRTRFSVYKTRRPDRIENFYQDLRVYRFD